MSSVLHAFHASDSELVTGRVVVVDNASLTKDLIRLEQGLAEMATCELSPELAKNARNLGFSGGMNTGIEQVQNWEPDYVWLLNNDTLVDKNAISALLSHSLEHPKAMIVGSTIVNQSSGKVAAAGGYKYFRWLGWNRPCLAGQPLKKLTDLSQRPRLDYIDGAALWIQGSLLRRAGGIPEQHFLYFEELELTHELEKDESIAWCPSALVYHTQGSSSPTPALQARSSYHAAFSAFDYTRRHHPICLPTVISARLIGLSLRALIRCQPQLMGAVFAAVRDFLLGRNSSHREQ